MSDFEPGRLYLLTTGDDTFKVTLHPLHGSSWVTLDGGAGWPVNAPDITVRPAIVLDPQDEDVKRFVEYWEDRDAAYAVADMIAAQITPPKPVMAEPVSEALVEPDGLIAITFRKTPKMWHEIANILDTSVHSHVGDTIRTAVPAPMAEPKWIGERVEDDRGLWVLTGHAYEAGPWFRVTTARARDEIPERSHWSGMVNPRPYEGVRDGE